MNPAATSATLRFDGVGDFSGGLAPAKIGDKWGYIDTAGRLVIARMFDSARSFSEGLAPVQDGVKWGYIP